MDIHAVIKLQVSPHTEKRRWVLLTKYFGYQRGFIETRVKFGFMEMLKFGLWE